MPTITDWIMVIITIIYVIATIEICWANIKSAKASKEQLNEMRKQFDEDNRPRIEVELVYEKRSFFALRFVNHGRYTAQHVMISLKDEFVESIEEDSFVIQLKKQKGKECIIGIDQHYDLFFGSNEYLKNDHKKPASGTVTYQGNGHKYTTEFSIDLDAYMTIYSVNSEQEDLLRKIDESNRNLKRIGDIIHGYQFNKRDTDKP